MALKHVKTDKIKVHANLRDEESKKIYNSLMNANTVRVRLSMEERILLSVAMKRDNFTTVSGYIKYKLFGNDSRRKYSALVCGDKLSIDEKLEILSTLEETLLTQIELYSLLFRKGIEQIPDTKKHFRIANALVYTNKTLTKKLDMVIDMQSSIISTLKQSQK